MCVKHLHSIARGSLSLETNQGRASWYWSTVIQATDYVNIETKVVENEGDCVCGRQGKLIQECRGMSLFTDLVCRQVMWPTVIFMRFARFNLRRSLKLLGLMKNPNLMDSLVDEVCRHSCAASNQVVCKLAEAFPTRCLIESILVIQIIEKLGLSRHTSCLLESRGWWSWFADWERRWLAAKCVYLRSEQ